MFYAKFLNWRYGFYAAVLLLKGLSIPTVGLTSALLFLLAIGIAVGPRNSTSADFPRGAVDAETSSTV
jgi:hypothetical protein